MTQYGRPIQDITVSGWVTQSGGTTNLYATLDEVPVPDHTDYVETSAPPGNNEYEVKVSALGDPEVSSLHRVRYWRRFVGESPVQLSLRLMQGTTEISTLSDQGLDIEWGFVTWGLTAAQADAITDYTDLRVEFVASQV